MIDILQSFSIIVLGVAIFWINKSLGVLMNLMKINRRTVNGHRHHDTTPIS